jgi:hypothetical protein|nr:DUF1642 domain-containing protein [uncultured Streptococcus sp.]
MKVQRLIEKYKKLEGVWDAEGAELARQIFLQDLEQLDEPKKVTIPQMVAEIIEYYKGQNATLYDALREKNFNKQYSEWLLNEQNAYDKVARAWVDGYEVKKEKQYLVKIRATKHYFAKDGNRKIYFSLAYKSCFTKKELEEVGFGWVFDCPGIEIEEVE